MNCIQKQQLVSFPKVRIWKPWFRHFNNHKEFRNEGTVHLFSLMALFSYANFRSNERMISGERYMEAPGQWICKLGSLPRILRVHSKRQALEQLDYYEKYGFLTYEWLDEENEIIRFSITNWKEHCTSLLLLRLQMGHLSHPVLGGMAVLWPRVQTFLGRNQYFRMSKSAVGASLDTRSHLMGSQIGSLLCTTQSNTWPQLARMIQSKQ